MILLSGGHYWVHPDNSTELQHFYFHLFLQVDRTKKNYFEDESKAVDVRDKATDAEDKAKGRKKDMMSFFQSTATLKRHAGKLSAKQEELDIR